MIALPCPASGYCGNHLMPLDFSFTEEQEALEPGELLTRETMKPEIFQAPGKARMAGGPSHFATRSAEDAGKRDDHAAGAACRRGDAGHVGRLRRPSADVHRNAAVAADCTVLDEPAAPGGDP